jgi:uncharacterized cupin superfamily protein
MAGRMSGVWQCQPGVFWTVRDDVRKHHLNALPTDCDDI